MYRLQDKIGKGGYANVYKCVDHVGVRYVAKELPKSRNTRLRVRREVDVLKKLQYVTRVARYVDAFENDDNYYVIQEWCKGGDITMFLESRNDKLSENTVASIVRGTLRSLHHIHSNGVIHRDVKMSNIMFADKTDDAELKILDFGAAVLGGSNDIMDCYEHGITGTPWFLSPEALCHKICFASDIWSVGIMTYFLLSGSVPFNDWDNTQSPVMYKVFRSIFEDELKFNRPIWKEISEDAKEFISKCLQKDWSKRYLYAETALQSTWLQSSDCTDRFLGKPLEHCVPFLYDMNAMSIILE
jgi:calcium-dependent protein kinase